MPIVTTFIKIMTYLEGLLAIESEKTYFSEDDFFGISTAIAKIAMLLKKKSFNPSNRFLVPGQRNGISETACQLFFSSILF